MKNWARNVVWDPAEVLYPASEEEIQGIVRKSVDNSRKIRIIGTGHSFTPLCETNEIMISLDHYQGLISVDQTNCQARVKAGTKLRTLGTLLYEQGMAMENLGDIDVQSLAGTISTGTHGTGREFGTILSLIHI